MVEYIEVPNSYLFNHYGTLFYHIVFPDCGKSTDCVFNFPPKEFKEVSGSVHLVLRIGGKEGGQVFIENNRNPNNEEKVSVKDSQGKSVGKTFMEQYLPIPECFDFITNCMKIFKEVVDMDDKPTDYEFKKMVNEVFLDDKTV